MTEKFELYAMLAIEAERNKAGLAGFRTFFEASHNNALDEVTDEYEALLAIRCEQLRSD